MHKYYLAGLAVLVLGLAHININHHLELPTFDKYRITTHLSGFGLGTTYEIQLGDEIKSSPKYKDVVTTLINAGPLDTVVFHLAGMGGDADGMQYIISNIKASKATVIMKVDAPVYSAHAYLAIAGDKLIMAKNTYLMFHVSTLVNLDCSKTTGTDRGVDNIVHCNAYKDAGMKQMTNYIMSQPVLTAEEKATILSGHDVYLDDTTVNKRLGA